MFGVKAAMLAAMAALTMAAAAHAQSSPPRQVEVFFSSPNGGEGYSGGSAQVRYAFLNCAGELQVAYSLERGSVRVVGPYRMAGQGHALQGSAPDLTTVDLRARAYDSGGREVGAFADAIAGESLGMGCFTGQTKSLGRMSTFVGANPTPAQIDAFLDSLILRADLMAPLRNAALESTLRADERRKAAELAQVQAEKERQEAEARRLANARAAEAEVQRQAQQQSQPVGPRQAAPPAGPPPLSDAERASAAIAADKRLADQRLEEQRRALASQQAAAAEVARRQAELDAALVAGAAQLGTAFDNFLAEGDRRKQAGLAADLQAVLSSTQCFDANDVIIPRGEIKVGETKRVTIDASDCGRRASYRFEFYAMVAEEPMTLRVKASTAPFSRNRPWVEFRTREGKVIASDNPCIQIWCKSSTITVNVSAPGIFMIGTGNDWEEGADLIRGFGDAILEVTRVK